MKLGDEIKFITRLERVVVNLSGKKWKPVPCRGSGIWIGWRTLSDGVISYDSYEEEYLYKGTNFFRAELVVTDPRKKPIFVLLESV